MKQAESHTQHLPHKRFHQLINRGLLGLYLSDEKVRKQSDVRKLAKEMLRTGGPICYFFYINALFIGKSKALAYPSKKIKEKRDQPVMWANLFFRSQ